MVCGFKRFWCTDVTPSISACPPAAPQLTWWRPGQVNSCSKGCELGERTGTSEGSLTLPSPLPTPSPLQPHLALPAGWARGARLGSRVLRAPRLSSRIRSVSWGGEGDSDTSSCHQPWLGDPSVRELPRAHLEARGQHLRRGVPVGVAGRWHRGPGAEGGQQGSGSAPGAQNPRAQPGAGSPTGTSWPGNGCQPCPASLAPIP